MPFQLRTVNKPTDSPKIVVYANFRDFRDKAPKESKYLTHEGVIKPKKFVSQDNFLDVAVEVSESPAPSQEFPHAVALVEAAIKGDSNPAPVANTPSVKPLPSPTHQPMAAGPPMNFDALGKVLSEAITNSVQGSTGKAAEAWTAALKTAVEESNSRLKETLESLSHSYLELGSKVTEALNSGVLDQVADKRFQDIQRTLEALNEKALAEIRKDKSGIEEIRREIDKKLGNLGHLASDIQEDSADVMRRVEKFKLGTAEMLQQQMTQLQKQLAEANDDGTKLRRELLEIRCSQGKQDPEYILNLEKKAASLPGLEHDIREKDLKLKRHELELNSLRALSNDQFEQFRNHQRLEELEARAQGFERDKEDYLAHKWVSSHGDYERLFATKYRKDFQSKDEFTRMECPKEDRLPADASQTTETWLELRNQRDELLLRCKEVDAQNTRLPGNVRGAR